MNPQIIEEIMAHFGRTGPKKRPRIRKYHAEILYSKYTRDEKVLSGSELSRPKDYIDRMIKYSQGFLKYLNEDALEIELTAAFFEQMKSWLRQYSTVDELDDEDDNWAEQGILVYEDGISFDGKLIYSKFQKLVSDEGESINDPRLWEFNDKNIESYDSLDFSNKNSSAFSSRLFLLKFYVLRKIDEVAFVTSRFVHCPKCKANYVIHASKTEFQTTYKCENMVGDKPCNTALKKFPARKMIPTYIYEISVEVKSKDGTEFKEFFLESFVELTPGFFTGMVFGRTEAKSNSFYFLCLTAREEKSRIPFELTIDEDKHKFFSIVDSVMNYIKSVGFVIDNEKAKLVFYIETLKKLILIVNKEINLDHSLYFGAPGIGKTYAINLLNHVYYPNSGFISGPRFSLPGLTGGQREILYQDTSKKKNVPGMFSCQSFIFDEINNDHFLKDDKAVNLFKSSALASSGTASVVGGKEFRRISLVGGTANYDTAHLVYYENKIQKIYNRSLKKPAIVEQKSFVDELIITPSEEKELPNDFDFYAPIKDYGIEVPKELRLAVLKVRDEGNNYLTNFPKPLMERFYWSVMVHPKHDREFLSKKKVDVLTHLKSRHSLYSQRELLSQLYVADFDTQIINLMSETKKEFADPEIERQWSKQASKFLDLISSKYINFFSMLNRISQVHVFALYTLSLINGETELSFETKRIFERLISLCHTPIKLEEFHYPDFINYRYLGESRGEMLDLIKRFPDQDLREYVDFDRKLIRTSLVSLENSHRIIKTGDFSYIINTDVKMEVIENVDNNKD